jgi:hypothetical protein
MNGVMDMAYFTMSGSAPCPPHRVVDKPWTSHGMGICYGSHYTNPHNF